MSVKLRQIAVFAGLAIAASGGAMALCYAAGVSPADFGFARVIDPLLNPEHQRTVSVKGQVTYFDRDRGIVFLQAGEKAWRIETGEIDRSVAFGAYAEATGTAGVDFHSDASLESATVRVLNAGPRVHPQTVDAAHMIDAALTNRLVSVSGKVVDVRAERLGQLDIALQLGDRRLNGRVADWTGISPAYLSGKRIDVEGVLDRVESGCSRADCFVVLIRDRASLHLPSLPMAPPATSPQLTNGPSLRQVSDIHRLPAAEAERHLPLRLHGVVTISNGAYMFVQDATGGIFVDGANGGTKDAKTGDAVVVTGQTGGGQFAPVVIQPHIEHSRQGILPTPKTSDLNRILAGSEDSNWISMEGIVRSAGWERNMVYLRAENHGVAFRIAIVDAKQLPEQLIDTRVRVEGVCATEFNRLRQLVGFYVMVPSVRWVQVIEKAGDASNVRLRPISEFGSFSPALKPGHRERVRGVVTFQSPSLTYVQDATGSLQVQPAASSKGVKVGNTVEAIGFSASRAFGPVMLEGSLTKLASVGLPVKSRVITAEEVVNQGAEGELVTLQATLADRLPSGVGEMLILHAGRRAFGARLEDQHAPPIRIGSVVRVTGIPILQARPGHPYVPSTFTLRLGAAENVQVVGHAPWWNARLLLWVIGLVGITSALVAFWAVALRRQVRRQTSVIQRQLNEAQSLRVQAESAVRVKSEFLANMSHEIRTPLNGILGMTDLALAEDINPQVRDYLETSRGSGVSLLQVINDVLDLSKIEAGHMAIEQIVFDLEETVRAAAAILRPAAVAKDLELCLIYPDSAPRWFLGDPSRLRQVTLNLVSNAVKFTETGCVTVEVCCQPGKNGAVRARIEVRDTGIGILADKQGALFQSFTQADASTTRKYGGTGLGLAISRHLIELMQGEIGLVSEPGCGSTFWFELPLLPSEPHVKSLIASPLVALQTINSGCILLAEDNLVNQKVASRMLERMGFTIHSVLDGSAAIVCARETQFDAILMDCQMPGCDGYEATAQIRCWETAHGRARTPIIALTAHAMPGDRERCLESGMDDYLTKPLKSEDLRASLMSWISKAGHPSAA